jgi:hypothetical protein
MVGNSVEPSKLRASGIRKTLAASTIASSAKPPDGRPAQTRSPTLRGVRTSGAISLTTPPISVPGTNGMLGRF